jgi:hypothetical protein
MNIFGGLGLGHGATVQLVFKTEDGKPPKTATVKAGGAETETLPLYTNKSTVTGEVCTTCYLYSRRPRLDESAFTSLEEKYIQDCWLPSVQYAISWALAHEMSLTCR